MTTIALPSACHSLTARNHTPMASRKVKRLFLASAALCLACPLSAAWAGEFHVVDGRAEAEISEESRLYVDGALVATFVIDADHPNVSAKITTPAGRTEHNYALCGEITIRRPDGKTETHAVDSVGHLHNPDGRVFEALGANDFTDFYLADPNDPDAADHTRGKANACSIATS
nr:hypothetical protein [Acetobacter sacchari]